MFVLDKMSMPGWEFKTDHIEKVLWLLDQCVCDHCKQTEAQYKADDEEEYEDGWTYFKPETYDSWSALEKVEWAARLKSMCAAQSGIAATGNPIRILADCAREARGEAPSEPQADTAASPTKPQ